MFHVWRRLESPLRRKNEATDKKEGQAKEGLAEFGGETAPSRSRLSKSLRSNV
jgi:hypothetical protein